MHNIAEINVDYCTMALLSLKRVYRVADPVRTNEGQPSVPDILPHESCRTHLNKSQ